MNRPLLSALAVLALAPSLAPAQVLVETIPERRARCMDALPLLPSLEAQTLDYENGARLVVENLKKNPADPNNDAARYVGQGARMLRLIDPTAKGCAVAAPEVGDKFSDLSLRISNVRIKVLSAMTGMEVSP